MRKHRQVEDELPSPLCQYVAQLKEEDHPLPEVVTQRLKVARQAALSRFAAKKNQLAWGPDVLSWVSFGHPKVFAAASCALFLAFGLLVVPGQQPDDAMLLGADLPLEAFADNGFAPWQDVDQI